MRLEIIDGMRGHLLLGMMVAHLSFQPGLAWLGNFHHNRLVGLYDGEFFVLISGLLVGVLCRAKPRMLESLERFIGQRLKVIYKYYLLSAVPFVVLASTQIGFVDVARLLGSVLLLQSGGAYSDILPIYFYCFVCVAIFFFISGKSLTRCLIPSAGLYCLSLPLYSTGFFGLSGSFVVFDIAAWQFLFTTSLVLGFWHGALITRLGALSSVLRFVLLMTSLVSALVIGRFVDFYPLGSAPADLPGNWARMQLHPLFLIKIYLVAFAVLLICKFELWGLGRISRVANLYFGMGWLRNVGTYSIQMFTLHVFLMQAYKLLSSEHFSIPASALAICLILGFVLAPNAYVFFRSRTMRSEVST